jgi:hypothetical protein
MKHGARRVNYGSVVRRAAAGSKIAGRYQQVTRRGNVPAGPISGDKPSVVKCECEGRKVRRLGKGS